MFGVLLAAGLASAGNCGCASTFAAFTDAVETNYPGYVIKLQDEPARAAYRRFRDLLVQEARQGAGPARCRQLLDAYLAFFADEHLSVTNVLANASDEGRQATVSASQQTAAPPLPKLKARWTTDKVEFRLRRETDLDPIEGLWRDGEGQLAIVHDDALERGEYVAFRFRQHYTGGAGEILAFIRPDAAGGYAIHYKDRDGVWQKTRALLNNETGILTFGGIGWQRTTSPAAQTGKRQEPAETAQETPAPRASGDPLDPVFRSLGNGIHYLALPSFRPRYREPLLAILAEHGDTLAASQGLIVDLRGNSGGEAIHAPLAEYLLTGPVVVQEANAIRASEWNIEYVAALRESLGEQGVHLDAVLERMRANPGKIVPFLERRVEGARQYRPGPRRVVVLQDRGVGDAAEAFLLQLGQSGKVVTMGEATRGNIDYQQVNRRNLGCGDYRFALGYPLHTRTRELPAASLDDGGIAPDVRLSPVLGDWVSYAERWLRTGNAE